MGREAEERETGKAISSKAEATTAEKRPSGTLYTATSHTTTLSGEEGKTDYFHLNSGASDHLVPSKADLRLHRIRAAC